MTTAEHHITAAADRIPWNRLIAYGFGGLIPIALFNIAGQLMGLIGNIGLGLSAFWLGTVLIISRLWDAVSDPLMGHISDNVRTRWGRRRPFLLIGGIAVAVSFVVMWWVPKGDAVQAWFSGEAVVSEIEALTIQSPVTLLRLRVIEIGLPIVLCLVALWLLKFYPLSEKRAYEIKAILDEKKAAKAAEGGES